MNLHDLIASPLFHRLGWTLLHSLWQGAAIAGLLAVLLGLLSRASASARYLVASAAMLLTLALPVATFQFVPTSKVQVAVRAFTAAIPSRPQSVVPFARSDPNEVSSSAPSAAPAARSTVLTRSSSASPMSLLSRASAWTGTLEPALPWLVSAWMLGVFALSIWHLGGCIAAHRLQSLGTQPADAPTQTLLKRLTRRMNLRHPVRLLQSALVETPMVVGFLRPTILIPVSVLTGLAPGQIEAILAHELAHIRRHDYLVNLLQMVVETLLFYHPAVWWISRQVRREREHCCDDLAVQICGDRLTYTTALAAIEEVRFATPATVLAAGGNNPGELLGRIRRLLGLPARRPAGALLAACLLIGAILLVLFSEVITAPAQPTIQPATQPSAQSANHVLDLHVIDSATRRPLRDVSLSISADGRNWSAKTDAQGVCLLRLPRELKFLRVVAAQPHYVPTQFCFQRQQSQIPIPETFTLEVEPGTVISGTVQNEAGEPVEGATVFLETGGQSVREGIMVNPRVYDLPCTTDAGGHWSCDQIPAASVGVGVRLVHPEYISDGNYRGLSGLDPSPAIAKLRDGSAVLVMRRGFEVAGRVLDSAGHPIAGANVSQTTDNRVVNYYPDCKTDDEGNFVFPHTRSGQVVLSVQAKGYAPDLKLLKLTADESAIEFRLQPGKTIHGVISDPAGKPIEKAYIVARYWRGFRVLEWEAKTDAQGQFAMPNAPSDAVNFEIAADGYQSATPLTLTAQDAPHAITLGRNLCVRGTVVDDATGQPLPHFAVIQGSDEDGLPILWQRPNKAMFTDGRYESEFSFNSGPGRRLLVQVVADGYVPAVSRVFKSEEGNVVFDVRMKQGAGPEGVVLGTDGKPLAGATVVLGLSWNAPQLNEGRYQSRGGEYPTMQSGSDGRFSFPAQADAYSVIVIHEHGFVEKTAREFAASKELRLIPWGRVQGQLLSHGKPVANEKLGIWTDQPAESRDPTPAKHLFGVQTDAAGSFSLEHVPAGKDNLRLSISRNLENRDIMRHFAVRIEPGKTSQLTMGAGGRDVIGRAVLPAGAPDVPGARGIISIQAADATAGEALVQASLGEDQSLHLDDIAPGSYEYQMNLWGGEGSKFAAAAGGRFTVLPSRNDDSSPVDLGSVLLVVHRPLKVGDVFPHVEFPAEGNDRPALNLNDYRGRVMLLVVWDSCTGRSDADLPFLNDLARSYERDPHVALISLNLDKVSCGMLGVRKAPATLDSRSWTQRPLNLADQSILCTLGVEKMPFILLVGPDGKVLAKDLHGAAIKEAVARAMP